MPAESKFPEEYKEPRLFTHEEVVMQERVVVEAVLLKT